MNLKLNGLHVDPKSLGTTMLLTKVTPYYGYVDNQRTDKVEGYTYFGALPARKFQVIGIKVAGQKLVDVTDGHYIPVDIIEPVLTLYYDAKNRVKLSAKASSIRAVNNLATNRLKQEVN